MYFARIAEDGSLTKAAGVLRIAQPALSRQIRLLEEELGVSLFTRTARGMRLTEEGEYLRTAAAGPLRALELALQNVRTFSSGIRGDVAIGMPSGIGDVLALPLVQLMNAQYPDIRLRIVEGLTGSLIDWLNRGMIDFALLEGASKDDRLTDMALFAGSLSLIGGPDAALDPDRPIAFKDIARHPLIVPSHHLGIRPIINEAAARTRMTLPIHLEADSTKLIKQLVTDGIGYAILPDLFIEKECQEGLLTHCPISSPALTYSIILSSRQNSRSVSSKVEEAVSGAIKSLL
jgi:DNA-binding transcriptional LysR family regulator